MSDVLSLSLSKPAERWSEALPLGNGRLGAMVWGGCDAEEFSLSESTFFSGSAATDNCRPGAPAAVGRVRSLLFDGRYPEAQAEASALTGNKANYGTNLPVGRFRVSFLQPGASCQEYQRSLDLSTGVYRCEQRSGGTYRRLAFLSQPDQVLVLRISGSGSKILPVLSFDELEHGSVTMQGRDISIQAKALETLHSDGATGVSLVGASKTVDLADGSVVVFWTMATDFADPDPRATVEKRLAEAAARGYESLLERHIADIQPKMARVGVTIEGRGDVGRAFQYGRYLLLCSSREDSLLPAHLQGAWNENTACRIVWTCDFHLDINTQMNYWPAEVTNLPETLVPLFGWMQNTLVPSGRLTARDHYGLEGWVAHLSSNPWGYSAPGWDAWWGLHPTGGAWLATHLWDHYRYNGDRGFLQSVLPVYEGAVEFFLGYLVPDSHTGWLLSGPSMSPENAFKTTGADCTLSMGCTADTLLIRELFTGFLAMLAALAEDHALTPRVREALDRLPPFQKGRHGQLREWLEDFDEADPYHRHTSHLLSLYPFHQIDAVRTPDWAEAARVSLRRKTTPPDRWEDTGWARSLLILYEARLGDGGRALAHVDGMLNLLAYPNLLIRHPPVAGAHSSVFELDGNTGLTTGVAEMLLQGVEGEIRLLPALPAAWGRGGFTGLRARGGWTVDCHWEDGRPMKVRLKADRDASVVLVWKNQTRAVETLGGLWVTLDAGWSS